MNHATTTVAVVGGGSLIGTHLVELLHAERPGWRLRVVDNFSTGREQELVELFSPDDALIRLDIRDREGCEEALTGCRIVFHLAAILSMSFERDARTGVEVNVLGMGNVLEATARAGARLVLASSSGGVHGIAPAGVVDESSPFHHAALPPGTAMYGAAKLLAEHRCRALADQDGLEWVTLRYSSVYGPRQHDRGRHTQALTENLRRLARGEAAVFTSAPDETHDYVHVRDAARANLLAAEAPPEALGRPYTIATGVATSNRELAGLLSTVTGCDVPPVWEGDRPARPSHVLDISAARSNLGYEPAVDLASGLEELLGVLVPRQPATPGSLA